MRHKTSLKRVLFVGDLRLLLLGVLSMFSIFATLLLTQRPIAVAATNSTINFQARLLTGTGAVVPDGDYNVEFKLYDNLSSSGSSQGSCSGDAHCLWVETRTSASTVHVVNGYLTVDLGGVAAFPTTINWDQDLYLSMNIGGTNVTPTWDGEMSPRLHLTSVPYAFRAGQLAQYNSSTGYTSTLNLVQPTGGNQIFNIPDQGAAGTYNLLTTAAATSGYIQLQGSTPGTAQTGNFNISGTGITGVALQTPLLDTPSGTTTLNIGTTNATAGINLNQNVTIASGKSLTVQGALTQSGGVISLTGSSSSSISTASGTLTLQSTNSSNNIVINSGSTTINSSGTVTVGSSGTSTVNVGALTNNVRTVNVGVGTGGSQTQTVNVGSTGGASATNISGGTGNINLNTTSSIIAKTTTNSTAGFQAQNASGTALLNVDTSNGVVQLNSSSTTTGVTVGGGVTIGALAAPSSVTVTPVGTAGSTTYTYKVFACDDTSCNYVGPGTSGSTATGNATLSGSNYNTISWNAVAGARQYVVYRTAGPSSPAWINTTATTSLNDTGSGFVGFDPPTTVTSGSFNAAGNATVGGTLNTNALSVTTTANINQLYVGGDPYGTLYYPSTEEVLGGIYLNYLSAPSSPTVTVHGTTGSTSYTYYVAACSTACTSVFGLYYSQTTLASSGTSISNGNATLSSTNYNTVSWSAITGAAGYVVYQTKGATTSIVAVVSGGSTTSYNDTGTAISSGVSLPSADQTGDIAGSNAFFNTLDSLPLNGVLNIGASGGNASAIDLNQNVVVASGKSLTVNGSTTLGASSTDRLTLNAQILGGSPFVFQGATDNSFVTTFNVADPTANRTITLPNASGTIVLNTSGSSQNGVSSFVQGGNTWATTATLGTNDANGINIVTNATTVASLSSTGAANFKNSTNSTSAFQVQNAGGTTTPFDVDTTNTRVGIGTATPTRTTDIAINTSSTNTLPLLLEQAGAGDVGLQLALPASSYYVGADATDGNFKISSTTSGGSTTVLGYNAVGASTDSSDANFMEAVKFTASASGTVSSLYAYIATVDPSSSNQSGQMAIYTDSSGSPGTKLASSSTTTLTGNSWNLFTITPTAVTSGTTYWLAYNNNGSGISYNDYKYDAGTSNQQKYVAQTFGTWPTTWSGGTFANIKPSFYANIVTANATDNLASSLFQISVDGQTTFQNATNSSRAFQVQNATGTALLSIDTTGNGSVSIGTTTEVQPAQLYVKSTAIGQKTMVLQAISGQTADILDLYNGSGSFVGGYDTTGNLFLNGSIQSGTTSAVGQLKLKDGTANNRSVTLDTAALSGNITLHLPDVATGSTICTTGTVCTGYAPSSGSANYINNTTTVQSANAALKSPADNITLNLQTNGTQNNDVFEVQTSTGGPIAGIRPSGAIWSAPITNPQTDVPASARLFVQANASSSSAIVARADASGTGIASDGKIVDIQDKNGTGTTFSVNGDGSVTSKNLTNSTTAFNVQNSGGTTVLNVDTTNQRVGVGTNAPSRTLDVSVNNTQVTAPLAIFQQAGTGDANIEFKSAASGSNYYLGVDASNSNAFTINSYTAATTASGAYTLGSTTDDGSYDFNTNIMQASNFTTSTAGTISAITVNMRNVVSGSDTISVALYADSSGAPGALLASSGTQTISITSSGGDNLNTISIPTTSVSASTTYWIAFNTSGDDQFWHNPSGSGHFIKYLAHANTSWPNPFGTPTGSDTNFVLAVSAVVTPTTSLTDTNTNALFTLSQTGSAIVRNSTDSTSAFQIQDASSSDMFKVDTTNAIIDTYNGAFNVNGVASPAAPTLTSSGTGGTLAAATYYYRLAAASKNGNETVATASSPGSVTTTGSTSKNTLSWTAVPHASSYTVYRSTDGGTTWQYNVVSSSTTSIADDGSAYTWGTTGSPSGDFNWTGGINMQSGSVLTLDGGAGSYGAFLGYDPTYNYVGLSNTNTGGGIYLQSDSFLAYRDTTNYNTLFNIDNTGQTTFETSTNSTTAFQLQNSSALNMFVADTSNKRIQIGSSTTDANAVLLILDSYSTAADPTGVTGAMYYNTSSNRFRCYENGAWENCVGSLATSNTSTSSLNGATTGIQNFGTTSSIPANYCTQGRVIHIVANGILTTTTTAQPIAFTVRLGSTTIGVASAASTPTASITNRGWKLDYYIICTAALGSSVAVRGEGSAQYFNTTTTSVQLDMAASATTTGINTTTANTINISVTFTGTASASNTMTLEQLVVQGM